MKLTNILTIIVFTGLAILCALVSIIKKDWSWIWGAAMCLVIAGSAYDNFANNE